MQNSLKCLYYFQYYSAYDKRVRNEEKNYTPNGEFWFDEHMVIIIIIIIIIINNY